MIQRLAQIGRNPQSSQSSCLLFRGDKCDRPSNFFRFEKAAKWHPCLCVFEPIVRQHRDYFALKTFSPGVSIQPMFEHVDPDAMAT